MCDTQLGLFTHSHTHETGLFSHIFVHAWGPVMNSIFTNRDCRIEMPHALGHFVVQQLLIYRSQGTLLLFRYTRHYCFMCQIALILLIYMSICKRKQLKVTFFSRASECSSEKDGKIINYTLVHGQLSAATYLSHLLLTSK